MREQIMSDGRRFLACHFRPLDIIRDEPVYYYSHESATPLSLMNVSLEIPKGVTSFESSWVRFAIFVSHKCDS